MQQCPNCGHANRPGVVFCENCGSSLIGKMPLDTKSLGATGDAANNQYDVDSSVLTDVKVQGLPTFRSGDRLRIELEGSAEPIVITPKAEAIFGRRDPATGALPDIDLTPFAGYRLGVSRRHAAIRLNDEQSLDVWDLGSSNGTFLNGQRLSAHRPYRLHDGDELRLGQMMVRIIFESSKTPAPAKATAPAPSPAPAEPTAQIAAAPVTIPVPEPTQPQAVAEPAGPAEAPPPAPTAPSEAPSAAPPVAATTGETVATEAVVAAPTAPEPPAAPAPPAPTKAAPAPAPAADQAQPAEPAASAEVATPASADAPAASPAPAQTVAISKPPVQAIVPAETKDEAEAAPPESPEPPAPPAPAPDEKRD